MRKHRASLTDYGSVTLNGANTPRARPRWPGARSISTLRAAGAPAANILQHERHAGAGRRHPHPHGQCQRGPTASKWRPTTVGPGGTVVNMNASTSNTLLLNPGRDHTHRGRDDRLNLPSGTQAQPNGVVHQYRRDNGLVGTWPMGIGSRCGCEHLHQWLHLCHAQRHGYRPLYGGDGRGQLGCYWYCFSPARTADYDITGAGTNSRGHRIDRELSARGATGASILQFSTGQPYH